MILLQICSLFPSKAVSGLDKPKLILRDGRGELEDPIADSEHDTGSISERDPSIVDAIKAWDSVNEHLFSALRLTTIDAARSAL